MSLFRKLFGSVFGSSEEDLKSDEQGKYMPEIKLPIDEHFIVNFKNNGGKFLYCLNLDEIYINLYHIIEENNWQEDKTLILDNFLKDKFESCNLNYTKKPENSAFFLTTCENLIANDGSILISSNQIAEKRLPEFPVNFVVFATTSQMVDTIGEGLRGIKNKNSQKIPSNITTIKHFKFTDENDNFLSYGSSSKNLYLLLLEDL